MSQYKKMKAQASFTLDLDTITLIEDFAKMRDIKPAEAVTLLVKTGAKALANADAKDV